MRRQLLATLVVLVTTPALALVLSADASAVTDYTSWTMRGDANDYILGSTNYAYGVDDGMTVTGGVDGLSASVDSWYLELVPKSGDTLQAGRTYTGATRYPFNEADEPGLSLFGHGRGCNMLTGRFTIHEITVDVTGALLTASFTFEQHCEGGPATAYGSVAWHAAEPAHPVQPTVSVKLSKHKVKYHQPVRVTASLSPDSPIRTLTISAATGRTEKVVKTVTVDSAGRASFDLRLTESSSIIVRFDGGTQFSDRTAKDKVEVAAQVTSKLVDGAGKRGQYTLYKASRDLHMISTVKPKHASECLGFHAQFQVRGQWGYDSFIKCVKLSGKGQARAYLDGDPRLVGISIRLRSEWKGDKLNSKATGAWVYAKFVR